MTPFTGGKKCLKKSVTFRRTISTVIRCFYSRTLNMFLRAELYCAIYLFFISHNKISKWFKNNFFTRISSPFKKLWRLQKRHRNQRRKTELYVKIVNGWTTIFSKNSILNVWQGSEYASANTFEALQRLWKKYESIISNSTNRAW